LKPAAHPVTVFSLYFCTHPLSPTSISTLLIFLTLLDLTEICPLLTKQYIKVGLQIQYMFFLLSLSRFQFFWVSYPTSLGFWQQMIHPTLSS
jgi:hypothetical protein